MDIATKLDSGEYLKPGFDPKSYTCALLRNVLSRHGIEIKGSEKKADLLSKFDERIKPHATAFLEAINNPKRSSQGIENAERSVPSKDHRT